MKANLRHRLDRLFAIDGTRPDEIALMEERLAALQPRMPWLYAMMLSCLVGMLLSFKLERHPPILAIILIVLTALRGLHWLKLRKRTILGEDARKLLRAIAIGSLIGSVAVMALIIQIVRDLSPFQAQLIMVMAATCTIAMTVPMTLLPRVARMSYMMFGIPASIAGILSGAERAASVASFNLLLCNFIMLYLLHIQDKDFVQQFHLHRAANAERKRAERAEQRAIVERTQAKAAAESDFLTGLPNRRAFLDAIRDRSNIGPGDTLMLLDLDGFKPVNDTFGHATGDELLKQVSRRLHGLCHDGTLVARLGGDEFALLARNVDGPQAREFGEKVVDVLGQPYRIGTSTIGIAACCGLAPLAADNLDPSVALREADLALYRAKATGRGRVEQYEVGLGDEVRRRNEIEQALRKPGVEDEIELAFQPIIDLETMKIASFEALARWSHSTLGPVSPADFIPITEQIQLVETLTDALLTRAIGHAKSWPSMQNLSFNLSAVQLCSLGSAERIMAIVRAAHFPPSRLQIEVTETAMLGDLVAARSNLDALRSHGVSVVLDDFGAGYASIGYLREMKFDKLKLDGSLVMACNTAGGAALLKGVVDLARAIGTPCIAEHVETMQQATLLRIIGCRFGQGYWLGKPVAPTEAETLSRAEALHGPTLRLVG